MKPGELAAAAIVLAIGLPMTVMLATAFADGQQRAEEAPLRAVFGPDTFDQLSNGESTPLHYVGADRTAPDFTLQDKDGNNWSMGDQRGKVVVMNFWTVTCAPCLREMPTLEDLASMYEGRDDVEVIAITTDKDWQEVTTTFEATTGQRFPELKSLKILFDPNKDVVSGKFGTRLFPETWIIDPDGVIRFRYDGALDWASGTAVDLVESFI